MLGRRISFGLGAYVEGSGANFKNRIFADIVSGRIVEHTGVTVTKGSQARFKVLPWPW